MQHLFTILSGDLLYLATLCGGPDPQLGSQTLSSDKRNVLSFSSLSDFKGEIHNIHCHLISQHNLMYLLSDNWHKFLTRPPC